ncbi:amidophosphoribosyltransferase [Candidatus Beckwithbacteria bacterium]|nr:amidophosphoribosyltransferase [Candidatus Beckwithbacteria bacterium]
MQTNIFDPEEPKEHCGLFGLYLKHKDFDIESALNFAAYGLQHRGHEGYGISVRNEFGNPLFFKFDGLVNASLNSDILRQITGFCPKIILLQTRYSTSGVENINANQPFHGYGLDLIHNGNVTNAKQLLELIPKELRNNLYSDSYIVFLAISTVNYKTLEERLRAVLAKVEGAANLVMYGEGKLYAYRDPWGFRPLLLAKLEKSNGYVVASESNFFRNIGAKIIREIAPGEGIVINEEGVRTFFMDKRIKNIKPAKCILEHIYFGAPDSLIFGKANSKIRRELGKRLALKDIENGFYPDLIIPVQHSGIPYAEGYAQEMIRQLLSNPQIFNLSLKETHEIVVNIGPKSGLIQNTFTGRVFIQSGTKARETKAFIKHRVDPFVVGGKRVAIIDDSIVRSITAKAIIKNLKNSGVKEVHFRVGSPPITSPCFMGIDFPNGASLIAHETHGNVEKIKKEIGCDSLTYLTFQELLESVIGKNLAKIKKEKIFEYAGYCGACFTGNYPKGIDQSGVWSKN